MYTKIFSLVALSLAMPALAMSPQDIYAKASESVVVVKALDEDGQPKQYGSGVTLAPGEIITNCHVLKEANAIKVGRKGDYVEAALLYRNEDHDLCLLVAPELKSMPTQLGKAGNLKVGAPVFSIGAPKGLELSLSNGLVSQLHLDDGAPVIQTTAAISPGSSGGGLFDDEARLVGITSFYYKGGQNLNFAVPVEWIADLRASQYFAWKTVVGVSQEASTLEPSAPEQVAAPAPDASAPPPEAAPEPGWTVIGESDHAHIYLRKGSIQKQPRQHVLAWVLFDYKSEQQDKDQEAVYWSTLDRYTFDCGKRRFALLSLLKKSAPAGKGEAVDSFDTEEHAASFSHAAPDTIGEAMLEAACSYANP